MSIQEHRCVTLRCDGCGEHWQADDGWTMHWSTVEEARADVTSSADRYHRWQVTDDGKDLCGRCMTRRDHEANGHDWTDWRAVPARGIDDLERRFCTDLDGGEEYRRHGQPIDLGAVRNLVAESRARTEGGGSR